MMWAQQYIGVPFLDGGYDPQGWHCWGEVWWCFKEHRGITLDKYDVNASARVESANRIAIGSQEPQWIPVIRGQQREFDVVVMASRAKVEKRLSRLPGHVGLMVSTHQIMHVEARHDTVCLELTHPDIRQRILGIYRHVLLA